MRFIRFLTAATGLLACALLVGCETPAANPEAASSQSTAAPAPAPSAEKGGQEEFGPYEVVENWPQPLPDGPTA